MIDKPPSLGYPPNGMNDMHHKGGCEAIEDVLHDVRSCCEVTEPAEGEDWGELAERTSIPAKIHTITENDYFRLLEGIEGKIAIGDDVIALPSKDGLLTIMWQCGYRFLCRRLTREETVRCRKALGLVFRQPQ